MSFATLFIALMLERFFDCSHLRNQAWYFSLQRLITQKLPGQTPTILLAACIIPLALIVGIIALAVENMLFGFIKLGFAILVILYCFGPRNLWADMFASITAITSGDMFDAANKLRTNFDINDADDAQAMHRDLVQRFLTQAYKRVFSIVFWYACLGVMGVVLYRFLNDAASSAGKEATSPAVAGLAEKTVSLLDWPAIRTLSFIFALGGNFTRVFALWVKKVMQGPEANETVLLDCGTAAMNTFNNEKLAADGTPEKEVVALFDRSLIIMLVIVGAMVFLI